MLQLVYSYSQSIPPPGIGRSGVRFFRCRDILYQNSVRVSVTHKTRKPGFEKYPSSLHSLISKAFSFGVFVFGGGALYLDIQRPANSACLIVRLKIERPIKSVAFRGHAYRTHTAYFI